MALLESAAFATPQPGTYGNLQRGSLHGPNFKQVDLKLPKHVPLGPRDFELRVEVFNLFNFDNFQNPRRHSRTRFRRAP